MRVTASDLWQIRNTDAFGECQNDGMILRAVAGLLALGHVIGCCCRESRPVN